MRARHRSACVHHSEAAGGRRTAAHRLPSEFSRAHRRRSPGKPACADERWAVLTSRLGFLRFGKTIPPRFTSRGRSLSTSLMRAPVAQRVVSRSLSRSLAAARMIALTPSGDSPSGGCQRLPVGLRERRLASEFDSTRRDSVPAVELDTDGRCLLTAVEFNTPIGRLNSSAPRQSRLLMTCTLVVTLSRSGRSAATPTRQFAKWSVR